MIDLSMKSIFSLQAEAKDLMNTPDGRVERRRAMARLTLSARNGAVGGGAAGSSGWRTVGRDAIGPVDASNGHAAFRRCRARRCLAFGARNRTPAATETHR
jgi:uncharacterized membrane protein